MRITLEQKEEKIKGAGSFSLIKNSTSELELYVLMLNIIRYISFYESKQNLLMLAEAYKRNVFDVSNEFSYETLVLFTPFI